MIEDMRHLEVFHAHMQELQACIEKCNAASSGVTNKEELLAMRLKHIAEIVEVLRQQKRALDFMAGNKVEPEAHFAEAVLVGTMGGGAV